MRDTSEATSIDAFLAPTDWAQATRHPLAGDASARRYLRLTGGPRPALLMIAPPDLCGQLTPFTEMTAHLQTIGLRAPEIFAASPKDGLLLLEDFGDALLAKRASDQPAQIEALYTKATDVLIHLHKAPLPERPEVGPSELAAMLEPLFTHYAPGFSGGAAVMAEMERSLAALPDWTPTLAMRDYHAENLVLCTDGTLGLLDYQDAVITHPAYDLASLLQDARRIVPADVEQVMITRFLNGTGLEPVAFRTGYTLIALQRNLRILGIFARLSAERPGAKYATFQPIVWHHVQRMLATPEARGLAQLLADIPAPGVPA